MKEAKDQTRLKLAWRDSGDNPTPILQRGGAHAIVQFLLFLKTEQLDTKYYSLSVSYLRNC